jgi:predicted permease
MDTLLLGILGMMRPRRQRFEDNMEAELRFHIESYTADLIRNGLDLAEAQRRARIAFGSIEASKEECRQAWGLQSLDELRADLRHTFRAIRHNPGFAAAVILSLALGIGANTAIFGVYDAVMLRLLPVRDPGRLVFVRTIGTAGRDGPPYPLFELIRDRATSFEAVSAFSPSAMEVVLDQGRELARGLWITGNVYQMLGVRPLLGRTLTANDRTAAVISRDYWQARFHSDRAIVGRNIYLFQDAVTIIGIMPNEAMSLDPGTPIDIAAPIALSDPRMMRDRTSLWLEVIARLKPQVRLEQARAETAALFNSYMADVQVSKGLRGLLFDHADLDSAAKGRGGLRSQYAKPLTALMILAALVLLAACVNMTNLMLSRALARQKDFAVRMAIGAGRARLIRQSVTESLVLAGAGAALGVVFARLGQKALTEFLAGGRNQVVLDLPLNLRVLLFTLGIAILSALALGIIPALRVASLDPAGHLQGGSRGIAGNLASIRVGRVLVSVQVSLSMVLLAGAGLFIRTLRELRSVDLGFAREGILTMEVTPQQQLIGSPQWLAIQTEILEQVRRIPGIRDASWATVSPFSGRDRGAVVDVPAFVPRAETDKHVHLAAVSADYFGTLGVPLLLGRSITARDYLNAPKVAVLSETAARFYFGQANPIGQKIRFTNYPGRDLYEVIGVAKDIKHDNLRETPARLVFVPIPQSPDRIGRLTLAVRCIGDPNAFALPVQHLVRSARSTLLINAASTMEKQIGQSLVRERLVAALSVAFGAVALVLACIGLYGILAYSVVRRTNEIGIRMALGATGNAVVRMILREAFVLAITGIFIGLPIVLALGRVIEALLYGVKPFDPIAFTGAAFLLLLFTALAAILPGRGASSLDPTSALRRD